MWNREYARALADNHMNALGDRWKHARTVGKLAEILLDEEKIPMVVACAAWLHDVGYAPSLFRTGFHSIDGALFLLNERAPNELVGLIAHHTGAACEAEERGLTGMLDSLPIPNSEFLDALTFVDLLSTPSGEITTPRDRVAEILARYEPEDPVHRAVTRSQGALLEGAERARRRLDLSDVWPLDVFESVGQALPH